MSQLEQINQEWTTLKNLARDKILGEELADFTVLANHYQELAKNQARDYDAQILIKNKYESLGEWEKVVEIDKEIARININLQPLNQARERLSQKLTYMEDIKKELVALKDIIVSLKETSPNSNASNNCACDNSSLEKKVDQLKERIDNYFPIDFNPIFNKLDSINISNNEAKNPTELAQGIPEKVEPTEATEKLAQEQTEQIEKENNEELANDKIPKETQNILDLKNEVSKLALNDLERALLKDSQDKEHIEAIRNQAQTRIDKELAENKEELEKEAKEKAEAEQKEQERLAKEQAEKERLAKEKQELDNLKIEVELLNPNPTEKELLTNATNKEAVEQIKNQINERIIKEKAEREKWVKEFSNFKTEIEKLGLNASEQKQLDDAIDKWQAEKVKSDAEARIKQESERKERLEARRKEAEQKWNVLTFQEQQQIADNIFNADKKIVGGDSYRSKAYNSVSEFKEDFATNKEKGIYSWLLHKAKNGMWVVIYSNMGIGDLALNSTSKKDESEMEAVREIAKDLNVSFNNSRWGSGVNKDMNVIYSLMYSLAFIRKFRSDFDSRWMENENNWLPQMEAEFAKYGL